MPEMEANLKVMEHIKKFEKRTGVDIGYHESNLYPKNNEGRVGKAGIDKSFSLHKMMEIAYKMDEKPNIIIKGGKNAKWYLKSFPKDVIEEKIEKQKWRDTRRVTMYIIEWD